MHIYLSDWRGESETLSHRGNVRLRQQRRRAQRLKSSAGQRNGFLVPANSFCLSVSASSAARHVSPPCSRAVGVLLRRAGRGGPARSPGRGLVHRVHRCVASPAHCGAGRPRSGRATSRPRAWADAATGPQPRRLPGPAEPGPPTRARWQHGTVRSLVSPLLVSSTRSPPGGEMRCSFL